MSMLRRGISWIVRGFLKISHLSNAIAYMIVTIPFFEKYKLRLLSTLYQGNLRTSYVDNLLYEDVMKNWLKIEYYGEKDPIVRDRKKTLLISGGSADWAMSYDEGTFDMSQPYMQDKTRTIGEGQPLYLKLKTCIEQYIETQDCTIIQVGVASGRELHWFAKQFPTARCIGTDAFEGSVEYARVRFKAPNLEYILLPLERADELLEKYRNTKLFFYTSGLFHFVQPEFVDDFFKYLSTFQSIDLFISEPVSLPRLDKEVFPKRSIARWKPLSWTHNYPALLRKNNLSIQEIILTNCTCDPTDFHAINCFIWAKPSASPPSR